jgi:anaerobic selenocysteine-containing dehydrogenase
MATAVHTTCPLDCPDRCSLLVDVKDGAIRSIDGSHVNPVTAGFICSKVRGYGRRVNGPDRLRHPLLRCGPKGEARFERTSWDTALGRIAERLEAIRASHGGEAILPFAYGGSNGLVSQGLVDEALFRALGALRLERTVCAIQTGLASEALYGKMASVDFPDFEQARVILIWGANPRHSSIHLMPYLKRAREAGARIAVIDPRCTLGERYADWHLPVRPGTDVVLALAMIGHVERLGRVDRPFLEKHAVGHEALLSRARGVSLDDAQRLTGVEAGLIATVTEAYCDANPALIRCGWGVERNRNGEAAVAAILALPAIAGKFGVAGGGYALSTSEPYAVESGRWIGPTPETRSVNMTQLGRLLLGDDPKIRALFVYDANPAVTLPDQRRVNAGLSREDLFTVVFDQVLTDTARYADVVLPATTFLEHSEIHTSYGTYAVMMGEPVIPPVGEARSNDVVFRELASRMGIAVDVPEGDALLAGVLDSVEGPLGDGPQRPGRGVERLARLRRDKVLRFSFPGERPVQFVTAFPHTPDGRIQLWPEALGPEPYGFVPEAADPAHPLILISPSSDKSVCSTLGEYGFVDAVVELHPADADARQLRTGDEVSLHNDQGEVRVALRTNQAIRPGVAFLPKGLWNRHTRNGLVGTALVPDFVSPISGGACYNDCRVEVSPAR